jgi:PAS domain S-box-containing protein
MPNVKEQHYLAEERFHTFFEQSSFPIQIYDVEGNCIETNKAWEGLYQADRRNLQGYNVLQDPQLENLGISPYIRRAFAGETLSVPPIIYDPAAIGKPGRPRWIEGFLYPIRDQAQNIREVVMVVIDVTDRIESQHELERRQQGLENALKARSTLMGICGHELRTPLTSLKLQTQTIQRRIARGDTSVFEPQRVSRLMEFYDSQVDRLVRLIDEMLDMTRIETGKLQLRLEEIDLSLLLQDVLDRQSDGFIAAGCSVSSKIEKGVHALADRFRIEQVLVNLMTNASKYGKGQAVEISLARSGEHLHLSVRDHGIGIADEHQERIFHPFERAVSAIEISGLGLGLYISKEIVEAHGGKIILKSSPGQGANFTLVLPIKRSP